MIFKNKRDPRFKNAKRKEIRELIDKGTYEFVREEDLPTKPTILQSRFVLNIKNFEEADQYFRARLVIYGHIYPDKPRIVNQAPTVLSSSIRLINNLWSRNISQAFVQSDEPFGSSTKRRKLLGTNWRTTWIFTSSYKTTVWTARISWLLVENISQMARKRLSYESISFRPLPVL